MTQANKAKDNTEQASAKEKVDVEVLGSYGKDGKLDYDLLEDNLNDVDGIDKDSIPSPITDDDFPLTVIVDGYKVTISNDGTVTLGDKEIGGEISEIAGKYYGTDTEVKVKGESVTIPGGATISKIPGEYESVDNGLVIYVTNGDIITDEEWKNNVEIIRQKYDQFVWVPVDTAIVEEGKEIKGENNTDKYYSLKSYITDNNKYPMAVKKLDGTYSGILYDFEEVENVLTITPHNYTVTVAGYREPYVIDTDAENGIMEEDLQEEYKTMAESVALKGGFWVGRYETTNMNSSNFNVNTSAVNIVKGSTDGISNVTWYKMYEGQKAYKDAVLKNSKTTGSSMIWGSQWDQIMIWMKEIKNGEHHYITNSIGMGNYALVEDGYQDTTKPSNTGCFDVKNIYDLAGNVCDCTLEINFNRYRGEAGGSYDISNSGPAKAINRSTGIIPTKPSLISGSRLVLYLK